MDSKRQITTRNGIEGEALGEQTSHKVLGFIEHSNGVMCAGASGNAANDRKRELCEEDEDDVDMLLFGEQMSFRNTSLDHILEGDSDCKNSSTDHDGASSKYLGMPFMMYSKLQLEELNKNGYDRVDSQSSAVRPDEQIKHHMTLNPSAQPYCSISSNSRGAGHIVLVSQHANADNKKLDITKYRQSACLVHPALSRMENNRSNSYVAPAFESIAISSSRTVRVADSTSPTNDGSVAQALNVPEIHHHQASKQDPFSLQLPLAEQQCKKHWNAVAHATQAIGVGDAPPIQDRIPVRNNFAILMVLELFRTIDTSSFILADIQDHVAEFSCDQCGSRFIQQRLETATPEEKTMVFNEIMPYIFVLSEDIFANYVVQKILEHGTLSQRRKLVESLYGGVLDLSLHTYGYRVVQKALEFSDLYEKITMAKELKGNVIRCIHDRNANFIIQKCIEFVPQEHIQFIISEICGNVKKLSYHLYGCRVVQRVWEKFNSAAQQIIIEEILDNIVCLSLSEFGNYVVQYILEHGNPCTRSAIIRKFDGHTVPMSKNKFGSNVIEKALFFGSREDRQFIINEIFCTNDGVEPLEDIMKDRFANYVVQKALETGDDLQQDLILGRIRDQMDTLQQYTYGKHIVSCVNKIVASKGQ